MFISKMVTPAIPERVYAMCKIVEYSGSLTGNELRNKMEPDFLENDTKYFSDYRIAAEELELITVSDGRISLAVEPSILESIESMRTFINGKLEQFQTGQFYRVTKAYFDMSEDILNENKNVVEMRDIFSRKLDTNIDAPAMRGWRFWATFLGFGYLHDMFVIPNANVFLWDLIWNSKLVPGKIYSISEFIAAIRPMCNVIIDTSPTSKVFNYGVSNGLRTLHDMEYIKIEHILDQGDVWNLHPMSAHNLRSTITNITIIKEVKQ